MRVQVLKHVAFEGVGNMSAWLEARGATVDVTRFYQNATLPEIESLDLIIIMGGPMSVNDDARLPWLRDEKSFIAEALARNVPVVGVCLGAQLIANVLGARVYPNEHKEIGWFDVTARPCREGVLPLPDREKLFPWHGDTFELPADSVWLASSEACANQAFRYGSRVVGLQCHPETTPATVDGLVAHCGHELVPGRYIQTEAQLKAVGQDHYQRLAGLMGQVLDYVTGSSQ